MAGDLVVVVSVPCLNKPISYFGYLFLRGLWFMVFMKCCFNFRSKIRLRFPGCSNGQ